LLQNKIGLDWIRYCTWNLLLQSGFLHLMILWLILD